MYKKVSMSEETEVDELSPEAVRSGRQQQQNPRSKYAYSIIWGPLPLITWLIPCIGHMGITDSEGKVHDFQGPYYVNVGRFMVPETKFYRFSEQELALLKGPPGMTTQQTWDAAVRQSDYAYEQTVHNICCNNCHHHSAEALRNMGYDYSMLAAWWLVVTRGKYMSWGGLLQTWLPFLVIAGFCIVMSILK